ncbi:MAG: hypothetical protein WC602_02065 [archaeon]
MPYGWLEEKDLKALPKPFFMEEISPDCKIGFESKGDDAAANVIKLPESFDKLGLSPDMRKDLKRIEKKNYGARIVLNEENALEKSKRWFLELWNEEKGDFERRLSLWKKKAYTLSLYAENELLG